jgi:ABC-type branched-subunit amino acid transport system ATPase component
LDRSSLRCPFSPAHVDQDDGLSGGEPALHLGRPLLRDQHPRLGQRSLDTLWTNGYKHKPFDAPPGAAPLTVLDNLELGGYALPRGHDFRSRLEAGVEEAYRLFPVLRRRRDQLAGTLSGGEQQMLAIGRALMTRPRLLLCDEPPLGLAPLVVAEIMRLLSTLREAGTTILLVEQNARMALRSADRAYVLEVGSVVLSGAATDLLQDDQLKAAYLGG